MALSEINLCIFWIFTIMVLYCNGQTTQLTPANAVVEEGKDIDLVCRLSSPVSYVTWLLDVGAASYYSIPMAENENGTCTLGTTQSYLSDTAKYSYTCTSTVYQVTLKNVQRSQHNDVWSCISVGQSSGPKLTIQVQARVKSVTLTPGETKLNVKENTTSLLTCTTSSTRPAATVTWYKVESGKTSQINQNITSSTTDDDFSVTTSRLTIVTSRQQNGVKIYCKGENKLNTLKSRDIIMNVLFPPVVNALSDISMVEDSNLEITCTYTAGNPQYTTVKWSHDNSGQTWDDKLLTIPLIDKDDAGRYTCTASNTMVISPGNIYTGKEETSFNLVVWYSEITSFTLNNLTDRSVTVDENETVVFKCIADGVPVPTVKLTNSNVEYNSDTTHTLDYVIDKAQCLDADMYTCSASNEHSDKTSVKAIQLYVRCSPRLAEEVQHERISVMGQEYTFTLNVIAYPTSSFTWWKLVQNRWTQLATNNRYTIFSFKSLSLLIIRNLSMEDFTTYKLVVDNSIGTLEQEYILNQFAEGNASLSLRNDLDYTSVNVSNVVGMSVGATSGCFVLIFFVLYLVWRFRLRKAKRNNPAKQRSDTSQSNETALGTNFHNYESAEPRSNNEASVIATYSNEENVHFHEPNGR